MPARTPLVIGADGLPQQLQSGDTLGGSSAGTFVDYGSVQALTSAQQKQANANIGASRVLVANTAVTAALATLDFSNAFTADFDDYEIVLENIVPAANGETFFLLVQSGGSYQTTGYLGTGTYSINSATGPIGNSTYGAQLNVGGSYPVYGSPGLGGTVRVLNVNQASAPKFIRGQTVHLFNNGTLYAAITETSSWWNGGAGIVTGFRLATSSGSGIAYIAAGMSRVKVYGLR